MNLPDLLLPLVICLIVVFGFVKGSNVFEAFLQGAAEGMKVVYRIAPTMICITLCVGMLKASGGLELIAAFIEPAVSLVGIPKEAVPLMLMRPISGTGALSVFKSIISEYGPDSFVGRVVSVMQGSTETTFYTMALYYGVTSVKKTRHTLGAAVCGDLTGFVFSALTVRLLLM